eukprot:CAMPEP_0201953258 /NCGR_PEP_ID=MMETSP0904-20121228/1685_1 /ASSEMBLY_ACC=CAM_ASM_000553 /TAXON_ID=420261 /ORGANISM="Thalassiosira antarctica, Strain CCMP982" /LENGTH=105 /DNA_ID=CAMNT_0048497083 /DNA_START=85 /DNA_END=399 /DNA_ORIENTATION=-
MKNTIAVLLVTLCMCVTMSSASVKYGREDLPSSSNRSDVGSYHVTDPQIMDDFEASLVHAVVEENPPTEQGLRDEWEKQTGWYRKEDIYQSRQNKDQSLNDFEDW